MNWLVIALLMLVYSVQFLLREQVLPSSFALVPELLSGIALIFVAAKFVVARRLYLDRHYWFVLSLISLGMLCAIVWQATPAGAVTSGLRHYFKFFPLLLLPAAFEFTSRQLKLQLTLLALLFALQPPLSLYQRFFEYASEMHSGDLITGTLGSSGALSLLMVSAIAFVTCAYLRGQIGFVAVISATAYYCVPTMLNETKIVILLLPLIVILPLLFMADRRQALRKVLPVFAAGIIALVAFVTVYDFIAQYNEYNTSIGDFLTERSLLNYLYTADDAGYVSRLDSIALAIDQQSRDPIRLIFGLGPGNVSPSSIDGFEGAYVRYDEIYGANQTEVSRILWELGLVGALGYGLLLWFFLKDSLWLSREQGFVGYLGLAWFACSVIFCIAFFYVALLGIDELSAPFWFYSGVIAAAKARALAVRAADRQRSIAALAGMWPSPQPHRERS